MCIELAILAVFVFLYSSIAGGLERTVISGAMVFTAVGLVIVSPIQCIPSTPKGI